MRAKKTKCLQRVIALILVCASLLSHLTVGVSAEPTTEPTVYCGQTHEHTEACYVAPAEKPLEEMEGTIDVPALFAAPASNTIYFDLSLGNVTITATQYSGTVWVKDGNTYREESVSGTHNANNVYYVFQSNGDNRGYVTPSANAVTDVVFPQYTEITGWGEEIKGNTNVADVDSKWNDEATNTGRAATSNYIKVTGGGQIGKPGQYHVVIDNIWSNQCTVGNNTNNRYGGIVYVPDANKDCDLTLTFKGNNRLKWLYHNSFLCNESTMTICGEDDTDTLTVVNASAAADAFISAIGSGDEENAREIFFTKGYVYAGVTGSDYATAIGGGGSGGDTGGVASITIDGATVTAVADSDYGAGIGGGAGGSMRGAKGFVKINSGEVYAYSTGKGAAIGGGGSRDKSGGPTEITIRGGSVTAENLGTGVAIGYGVGKVVDIPETRIDHIGGTLNLEVPDKLQSIVFADEEGNPLSGYYADAESRLRNPSLPILPDGVVGYVMHDGQFWNGTLAKGETYTVKEIQLNANTVYFDLSLGNVRIKDGRVEGYITAKNGAAQSKIQIFGSHDDSLNYYVFQSNANNLGYLEVANGSVTLPEYARVDGWADYITSHTNNSDLDAVEKVVEEWEARVGTKRTSTENRIIIAGEQDYQLTIQDIWSIYNVAPNKQKQGDRNDDEGCIAFVPKNGGSLTVTFKGDNRLDNIMYKGSNADQERFLTLKGDAANHTDTLTVAATIQGANFWASAIGAPDNSGYENAENIIIEGGTIFAGTTRFDDSAAIGGGGNGSASVSIEGGVVIAVNASTAAAIGGGQGLQEKGGSGTVEISGGEVYAYNHGSYLKSYKQGMEGLYAIPVTAIGGAGSIEAEGAEGYVTISGGEVYAQSIGGTAIGGGGSATNTGGYAKVTISGGTVTAISKEGIVQGAIRYDQDDTGNNYSAESVTVNAGLSIGGGTAKLSGGYAAVTISGEDTVVKTGSIGGGSCTGDGPLGYAEVSIAGGTIQGQIIMQETGNPDEICSFMMTGGVLNNEYHKNDPEQDGTFSDGEHTYYFVEKSGGAVCMKDSHGVTEISGTAEILNCHGMDGGAIYMTGGTFTMTGGKIENCAASNNGGAIYVNGGNVAISGGLVSSNTAAVNGGGIAVNNGQIIMSGGTVSDNEAQTGSGGGMYVSAPAGQPVTVKVFSGTLSGNTAAVSGGAVGVNGLEGSEILVQIGVNENHFTGADDFTHIEDGKEYTHAACPSFIENSAKVSGGAFYINAADDSTTRLNIYCSVDADNSVEQDIDPLQDDKQLSSYLMVQGGEVVISTSENNELDDDGYTNADDNEHGRMQVAGTIHVVGGQLTIYGSMDNPAFDDYLTIDLEKEEDAFNDYRESSTMVKISYHENFKDADGNPDSTQTAFDIASGAVHQIETGLYAHDGYELLGWNTDPEANGDWYPAGVEFTFYNNESDEGYAENTGSKHVGDLTLYAIWKVNGYTITFDAGVAAGETWWGSVASISCSYVKKVQLPQNDPQNDQGFVYPGYVFAGWKLGETVYQPGDEVSMLTDKNADVVTFVAQWTVCEHPEGKCSYAVNSAGDTITKTCNTCQLSATAKMTTADAVYDAKSHPAMLECSNPSFWTPAVTYTATKIGKSEPVTDPQNCINAGNYTATITEDGKTVTATFTIHKAEQAAPTVVPVYAYNANETRLEIQQIPQGDRTSPVSQAAVEYLVRYYDSGAQKEEIRNGDNTNNAIHFPLEVTMTTYSVYIRYQETDNYLPSALVKAAMTFYFDGNVSLEIFADEGIDFGASVNAGGEMVLSVMLQDGFYLVGGDYTIEYDSGILEIPRADMVDDVKVYYIKAKTQSQNVVTEMRIGKTKKAAGMQAIAKEKEHFGNFAGGAPVSIARDSAFTAQYTVTGYYAEDYNVPELTFSPALPDGTTIIMRDRSDGSYWYYICSSATESVKLYDAQAPTFRKMGVAGDTQYTAADGDLTLQFVVDFSKADGAPAGNRLECKLRMVKKAGGAEAVSATVEVHLSNVTYALEAESAKELEVSLTIDAAASKYDRRDLALVLESTDDLPMDAQIDVKIGGFEASYRPKENGKVIIIPIGNAESMGKTVTLTLSSQMFPMGEKTYTLNAALYLSQSDAESAPLNGTVLASGVQVSFTSVRKETGIDVSTSDDRRIYTIGDKMTVSVATAATGYTIAVQLHEEQDGVYVNTALDYDAEDSSFVLNVKRKGNYCVVATLSNADGYVVAESRYYIIIKE